MAPLLWPGSGYFIALLAFETVPSQNTPPDENKTSPKYSKYHAFFGVKNKVF
jgi:hypothetical protein